MNEEEDEYDNNCDDFDPEYPCWQCQGDGVVEIGVDVPARFGWDIDGEIKSCQCCGGTGLGVNCTYW